MAGARLVEEVIARGGQKRFDIAVFGAEPYGNYNRILLSNVLAGSHDPTDIFINPLPWYPQNGVMLYSAAPVTRIDPQSKMVYAANGVAEAYDHLVIATGSVPFIPALENLSDEQGKLKDGVFVFRTLDDC